MGSDKIVSRTNTFDRNCDNGRVCGKREVRTGARTKSQIVPRKANSVNNKKSNETNH